MNFLNYFRTGKHILIVCIMTGIINYSCNTGIKEEKTFRNVIIIVGDDHSPEALGCYGNDLVKTPNLDRMAQEGIRFTNAYANAPLCSASRQSIMTGKYPHASGVTLLFTPFSPEQKTIADHLGMHSFKTCLIGKTHFNNWIWYNQWEGGQPKYGWDTIITKQDYKNYLNKTGKKKIPGDIVTYSRKEAGDDVAAMMNKDVLPHPCYYEQCEGTYFTREAINFIRENKKDRFCLWLAYHEVHSPFTFPVEYRDKYGIDSIVLHEGSPEDDRWIPAKFRDMKEEEKKGIIASYYTSTEYMDRNIGMLLDAVKNEGLQDNTLVIYLADQGYLLYDHKRFEKHTMWRESITSPLIITGGKNLPSGKSSDALIEFIDVFPTVTEALGLEASRKVQGNSFWTVLTGTSNEHKDYVFAEHLEDNMAMVASKKWKYIFMTGKRDLGLDYATGYGPPGITHQLYDLENDPGETTNLAYAPDKAEIIEHFQLKMLEIFYQTHPYAGEIPESLTTEGQLVWFCEPRDVGAEYGGEPLRVFKNK